MFKKKRQLNKCSYGCGCHISQSLSIGDKLRESINGKHGELAGLFTYMFQHFISKDEKLKDALLEIAEDEMEHIEELSYLLVSLGEMPYFIDGNRDFYTTKWVNYENEPKLFLEQNIESEKRAIKDYMDIIESIQDKKIIEVLLSIINDEKEHIEIFERLLTTVSGNKIN